MKTKKLTLCFLILGIMLVSLGMVSAAHTSTATISPSGWLKPNTATTFSFTVSNTGGTDIIYVKIAKPTTGFGDISCGTITNWSLILSDATYCKYAADNSSYYITSGNSKTFTVQATPSVSYGDKSWTVTTTDMGDYLVAKSITSTIQTIQNAIDTDTTGTVTIPAGTYTENVNVINKNNLIIQGVGITTIIEPASGIGFAIKNSDSVTIRRFTINTVGENAHGIWVAGTPNGIGDSDNLIIENNTINVNGYSAGIYAERVTPSHNGWRISGNTLTINIGDGMDLHDLSDSEVSSNKVTITNPTGDLRGSTNVLWTSELSNIANLMFLNNNVSGSSGSEVAFVPDFVTEDTGTTISSVTITGNTFEHWGSKALRFGARATGVALHQNKFLRDSQALTLLNEDASQINAENNWWIVTTNTAIDALIDGNVDFDPWWYDATGSADTTAPMITFVGAPYFTNGEIAINATITDDRGIANYTISFGDGDPTTVAIPTTHKVSVSISEKHTYSSSGDYTVTLTARDESNNLATLTTVVKVLSLSNYDWVIQLKSGWNLISIPYTLEDTSINSVFANILPDVAYESGNYTVLQYDAVDGTWYKNKPYSNHTGFYSTGTLKNIKPGYAYWIKMSKDAVLYGKKKAFAQEELPLPSINLKTGSWNLVGRYGVGAENGLNVASAFVYDLADNYYTPVLNYTGTSWNTATHINTYKGYWLRIKANTQSTIAYEPGAYYL